MKFLDQVKINARSGKGGNGAVSFRREKYIQFGGPDGGDGGRGGHVYARCVDGLNTLIDYRYKQHFKAKTGEGGMGRNRSGAMGSNVILSAPVGTQIFDDEDGSLIADMTEVGQEVLLLKGGNGGFGNARFKSSTNQAPRHANPGAEGDEAWFILRLKLIADAGLVGLPNAGKSTFLASVSAARPKIADYPFTTLYPNLGVTASDDHEFVLADIPGLIEGAHMGVGIGHRFLGHIERCQVILHLVDVTSETLVEDYKTVRQELVAYGADLDKKQEIIALSKCDVFDDELCQEQRQLLEKETGKPVQLLSAISGQGMKECLRQLYQHIVDERNRNDKQNSAPDPRWQEIPS